MSAIDINSGKLVEWIVSRLHLKADWRKKLNVIREKISLALVDMPESEEIRKLIKGKCINYYHCIDILNILKTTESESRNIFGQYSSKRYKDWQEIVKLYESNYLYLIDYAVVINQNILFEIPAVRKGIDKNKKTETECQRKEKLCKTTINEANGNLRDLSKKYEIDLNQTGSIDEDNLRNQLKKSVKKLKSFIIDLENQIPTLKESFDFYQQFIMENYNKGSVENFEICKLVSYLLERGNTTIYEWKYGKAPVIKEKLEETSDDTKKSIENEEASDEIKWDCEIEGLNDEFSMIDFGIEIEGTGQDELDLGDKIDVEGQVCTDNEIRSIFEDMDVRELLLDDLYELDSFLWSCLDELKAGSNFTVLQGSGEYAELNQENVEKLRKSIQKFIEDLTNKQFVHLLKLDVSESYIRSIIERFVRENVSRSRNLKLSNEMSARIKEANQEIISELLPRLDELKLYTKELKQKVECEISKKFDNRRVRITGEILPVINT